jgi:hypothetical protein
MGDAISMLERRFNVKVYCSTNEYDGERLTAKLIHGENLQETLNIVKEMIPGFRYRIKGENVFFY